MDAHKMTQLTITVACLALAGCASTDAATPTATPPPQPPIPSTATIGPSDTPTAWVIATAPRPTQAPDRPVQVEPPAPENTPLPTATSYSTPAVQLSPTGPWLIFRDNGNFEHVAQDIGYLWAMNQDGTGLTRLTNEQVGRGMPRTGVPGNQVWTYAVRPTSTIKDGITIAYYAPYNGSEIKLLSWPGGDVKTIVYNVGVEEMKWSPSGNKLAFVGMMGDIDLNVFVYDVATEQATRITVTNNYGDRLVGWSPDERFVIHQSLYSGMYGHGTNAVWSARADAGGVTQLIGTRENQEETKNYLDYVEYLGWLSPTEILVTFDRWKWLSDHWASNRDIRIINVETGDYTTVVSEPLLDVAYSPEHNLFLMTKDVDPSPNRLLIFYQNGELREIAGYAIKYVEWLSTYNAFLGQTPDGLAYIITPDGAVTEIPTPEWNVKSNHRVIVSPDGRWWVWHSSDDDYNDTHASELWVGPALAQPSICLSFATYPATANFRAYWGNVIWSPDGQYLLWSSRRGIFVARTPGFEPALAATLPGDQALFSGAVWVQ